MKKEKFNKEIVEEVIIDSIVAKTALKKAVETPNEDDITNSLITSLGSPAKVREYFDTPDGKEFFRLSETLLQSKRKADPNGYNRIRNLSED